MKAYKLFWLLKTDGYLYLITGNNTEECTVSMTASKPKKVNRTIELNLEPDNTFLLYESYSGGILWKHPVSLNRDSKGKLTLNITDILRNFGISFTFCTTGNLRYYKARKWELESSITIRDWGFYDTKGGFGLEETDKANISFFSESCYICNSEILAVKINGFGWNYDKLLERVRSLKVPFYVDEQTACQLLEEQGPLSKLIVCARHIRIAAYMFFNTSFEVVGFGKKWIFNFAKSMFQENGSAPCKTSRLGPLICGLLKADSSEAIEQALQWGIIENILIN